MNRYVYVAASLHAIDYARHLAKAIQNVGGIVTSRWHTVPHDHELFTNPVLGCRIDTDDVIRAGEIVALTGNGTFASSSGGRHVELGMGLAWNKGLSIIGPRESVFTYDPRIAQFDNAGDYLREKWG